MDDVTLYFNQELAQYYLVGSVECSLCSQCIEHVGMIREYFSRAREPCKQFVCKPCWKEPNKEFGVYLRKSMFTVLESVSQLPFGSIKVFLFDPELVDGKIANVWARALMHEEGVKVYDRTRLACKDISDHSITYEAMPEVEHLSQMNRVLEVESRLQGEALLIVSATPIVPKLVGGKP